MKSKGLIITLIAFLSLFTIALIVFLVIILTKGFDFKNIRFGSFNTTIIDELIYEKNYEETFENIVINSNASKVEIKESENNTIKVEVYGKENKLKINDKNQLEIEYKEEKCHFFCFNREIGRIVIYLPEDYENNLKIENDLGNVEVGKFENINLNIKEDAGNISIEEAKNVIVDNDCGHIKIEKADTIDATDNAGNIEIGTANIAKVENDCGHIKIYEINDKFDIENNCGNIEIEYVNIKRDSSAKTDTGNIKIKNKNDIYVEGSTDVGKVNIDNNNRKAEIKLELKSDVGTINVK